MSKDRGNRYVYVIEDEDGRPCYIGVGQGARMHDHVRQARAGYFAKNSRERVQYFIDCLSRGFVPSPYKVAEELTADEAYGYERLLIAFYGRRDLRTGSLLNLCDGGHGPRNPSPSLRAKRSSAMRTRLEAPEARETLRLASLGRKHTPDAIARMRQKTFSPEYRRKLSEASKGRTVSAESRAKIGASNAGRAVSPETLEKLKRARKGKKPCVKLTPDQVRIIRARYSPRRGSLAALARRFKVSRWTIRKIIHFQTWTDVGAFASSNSPVA